MEAGTKKDQGKAPMSLIPGCALEGMALALGYGAKKYNDFNYRGGLKFRRIADALIRHYALWLEGEDVDKESGLLHLDHMLANLAMLKWMHTNKPQMDDRYAERVADTETANTTTNKAIKD